MNAYRNILKKTFEKRIPIIVHWELTYKCNLNCVHCYAVNREKEDELPLDKISDTIDQLKGMNCLYINFTGGEIFCRPDIIDIIELARKKDFAIRLLTNGCLLDEKKAVFLAKTGILSVEFSLYSMNPEIHDKITRTPGSHQAVLQAIKMCRALKMNVAVKTMLLRYNIDELASIRKFADSIGVRFVFDYMLTPADNGSHPMEAHGMDPSQIFDFARKHGNSETLQKDRPDPSDPICGGGCNGPAISPSGDVFPCLAIRESVGNLRSQTFHEIWHSKQLDKYRKTTQSNLKECTHCPLLAWCNRCPGVAMAESGSLTGCSTSARMAAEALKKAENA